MERLDDHLLKPAEVIERLGVSRSWLYEAANSGRIPCVRLGGDRGPVRFPAEDLERWLEQARRERPAPRDTGPRHATSGTDASRRRAQGLAATGGSGQQLALSLFAPSDLSR